MLALITCGMCRASILPRPSPQAYVVLFFSSLILSFVVSSLLGVGEEAWWVRRRGGWVGGWVGT